MKKRKRKRIEKKRKKKRQKKRKKKRYTQKFIKKGVQYTLPNEKENRYMIQKKNLMEDDLVGYNMWLMILV